MTMTNNTTDIDMESFDELNARLSQASAMLTMTYGNEGFEQWSAEVKENYLWACSTMINQAKELAGKLIIKTEQ